MKAVKERTIAVSGIAEAWAAEADRFSDKPELAARLASMAESEGPAAAGVARALAVYSRAMAVRSELGGRESR